jgi:hypothetical protein
MDYDSRSMEEKLQSLIGVTLTRVTNDGNAALVMVTDQGAEFRFYHDQDCCEEVTIDDICGDLGDLVGSPILLAQERVSSERPEYVPKPEYESDSETWTFYEFATIKGSVTVRWFGMSNGYYSENVDLSITP